MVTDFIMSRCQGSQTRLGHCVVFLGEALFSHSASLQSGVKTDTGELWGGGGTLKWTGIPFREGVVLLLPS